MGLKLSVVIMQCKYEIISDVVWYVHFTRRYVNYYFYWFWHDMTNGEARTSWYSHETEVNHVNWGWEWRWWWWWRRWSWGRTREGGRGQNTKDDVRTWLISCTTQLSILLKVIAFVLDIYLTTLPRLCLYSSCSAVTPDSHHLCQWRKNKRSRWDFVTLPWRWYNTHASSCLTLILLPDKCNAQCGGAPHASLSPVLRYYLKRGFVWILFLVYCVRLRSIKQLVLVVKARGGIRGKSIISMYQIDHRQNTVSSKI